MKIVTLGKTTTALLTAFLLVGNALAMPQPKTQNGIAYISGGVGEDEEEAIRAVIKDYNVYLEFAVKGTGAYLSDVKVQVLVAKGNILLDTVSDGPCFFATLPAGRYKINVASDATTLSKAANVAAKRAAHLTFYWPSTDQEAGVVNTREEPEEAKSGHGIHGCW